MTIHEALRQALTEAATALAVPLFWEGEVFAPPMTPHIVAQITIDQASAASLGRNSLTRTGGALEANCTTMSGFGDTAAVALSRQVAAQFPRGRSLAVDEDELVFSTPVSAPTTSDGRRLAVPLKLPFYALTQEASCA